MNLAKKVIIGIGSVGLLGLLIVLIINLYVLSFSKTDYYTKVDELENAYVGLVFGAAVYNNTTPSAILKDRLLVARDAYESGKIKKILVSGDNSKINYNEPLAMKNFLVSEGVKASDIYMDHAGFDTYDSLYRAKDIFLVNNVILFTQDFHLKRAMYISKSLGIDTQGIETNLQPYIRERYYDAREILARVKAFFNVEIFHSKPKYLGDTIEILSDEQIHEAKQGIFNEEYIFE